MIFPTPFHATCFKGFAPAFPDCGVEGHPPSDVFQNQFLESVGQDAQVPSPRPMGETAPAQIVPDISPHPVNPALCALPRGDTTALPPAPNGPLPTGMQDGLPAESHPQRRTAHGHVTLRSEISLPGPSADANGPAGSPTEEYDVAEDASRPAPLPVKETAVVENVPVPDRRQEQASAEAAGTEAPSGPQVTRQAGVQDAPPPIQAAPRPQDPSMEPAAMMSAQSLVRTGETPQPSAPQPNRRPEMQRTGPPGTPPAPHEPIAQTAPAPTVRSVTGADGLPGTGSAPTLTTESTQRSPAAAAPPTVQTHRADWPQAVVSATVTNLMPSGGTMILELAPEELGALRIILTLEHDTASVQIQTETPEAAKVLNDAERALSQDFARHGVTLSTHDAQTGHRGEPEGRPLGNAGTRTDDTPTSDPVVALPPQGIINLIA